MDIKQLQLYLLSNYPYYYALLQQAKINLDEKSEYVAYVKVQTRIEITINPEKFSNFTVAEQAGLLIHELQHLYKDHIKQTQLKQIEAISDKLGIEANYMMANVAMDMEINPGISELVKSDKLGLPAPKGAQFRGVYPQDFNCHNQDSWVNYYAKLKSQGKIMKGKSKPGEGKPGDEEGSGDGQPHQDHDYFTESTRDEKMMDEIAANAAKRAKCLSAGNTPREIEKFLLDHEASKQVPWHIVLRQFMQSLVDVKTKNTWKKVNRRFRGKLPGVKKLPKLDLLIGIDMSGSMSDEDIKKCFAEVDAIYNTGMVNIEVAYFDTYIHHKEDYKKGFEAKRVCAGGTSFVPVHELAIEERYKGVIYLTDGYADFPNRNDVTYKCLWVLNSDVKPPYGNSVRIK